MVTIPRTERAAILAIAVLALMIRAPGLVAGFPDINRYFFDTDELGLMDVAMSMGGGDLNPHYYLHPSLLPYLLLGAFGMFFVIGWGTGRFQSPADLALLYWTDKVPFHLIGRLLVLGFSIASVYVVYWIGRRAYSGTVGIIGALFLAVAPLHVHYSQVIKTDAPSLFFALLAVALAVRLSDDLEPRTALWAGVCTGLAAGTRYPSGIFLLAPIVALAHHARPGRVVRSAIARSAVLLATGVVGGFVAANPYAVLDFNGIREGLPAVSALVRSPSWLMTYETGKPDWWIQHLTELAGSRGLTATLFAVSIVGIGWALWRRTRADVVLILPLLAFYVFYSLPSWMYSPVQFLLPVVPICAVLGGRWVCEGAGQLGWGVRAIGVALLALVVLPTGISVGQSMCGVRKRSTRNAREWIEANLAPNTAILMNNTHVPQLSFTSESLDRSARSISALDSKLSAGRRDQRMGSTANDELLRRRRETLTTAPSYDLHILEGAAAPDWDYYQLGVEESSRRYGIEYVITSTHDVRRYTNDSFDPALVTEYSYSDRNRFHRELMATGMPTQTFAPACDADVGILIYRVTP